MRKIKEKLASFMNEMKEKNPSANWANLFTGLAILVLVAFFSLTYFNKKGPAAIESQKPIFGKNEEAKVEQKSTFAETTTLDGEGLWQVAQRVCGDGEKYNFLALANNLDTWSSLVPGQVLKVECEPSN